MGYFGFIVGFVLVAFGVYVFAFHPGEIVQHIDNNVTGSLIILFGLIVGFGIAVSDIDGPN